MVWSVIDAMGGFYRSLEHLARWLHESCRKQRPAWYAFEHTATAWIAPATRCPTLAARADPTPSEPGRARLRRMRRARGDNHPAQYSGNGSKPVTLDVVWSKQAARMRARSERRHWREVGYQKDAMGSGWPRSPIKDRPQSRPSGWIPTDTVAGTARSSSTSSTASNSPRSESGHKTRTEAGTGRSRRTLG